MSFTMIALQAKFTNADGAPSAPRRTATWRTSIQVANLRLWNRFVDFWTRTVAW